MAMQNPHARFVEENFKDLEKAREIFSKLLPEKILKELNFNTLKTEDASFVTEELKEYQSDILFSVKTKSGQNRQIYVLFEHKSYVEELIRLTAKAQRTRRDIN